MAQPGRAGIGRADLTRATLTDLLPDLDPEALRSGPTSGVDHDADAILSTVLRTGDGVLVPVDVTLQSVDLGEGDRPILAVVRDATERVEVQARLQRLVHEEGSRAAQLEAILSAIGDALVVFGPDGELTAANPAAHEMFPVKRLGSFSRFVAGLEDPNSVAPRLGRPDRQGPVELRVAGGPHAGWS